LVVAATKDGTHARAAWLCERIAIGDRRDLEAGRPRRMCGKCVRAHRRRQDFFCIEDLSVLLM